MVSAGVWLVNVISCLAGKLMPLAWSDSGQALRVAAGCRRIVMSFDIPMGDGAEAGFQTAMEFNRNQYFMAGLVVFLLGLQLRWVEAFVLNERATQFLAQRMQQIKSQQVASTSDVPTLLAAQSPIGNHRIERPEWTGYSILSVGAVLILYSLALKKPGG
jgi:hypothetical protein